MAHFAEIDSNNKVLRVLVACNIDVANNGGDQSEQAAENFKKVAPLSENGVKWVQTSYNSNFKKRYASMGGTYDPIKNIFIEPQPYSSWTLNSSGDWEPPSNFPTIVTYGDNVPYLINWDEDSLNWKAVDGQGNKYTWFPNSQSWLVSL